MTEITSAQEASRQALRSLLSSYYGIEEAAESSQVQEKTSYNERKPSTGETTSSFQVPETGAATLIKTLNLNDLMKKTSELKNETEELNTKLKHFLYSSYQKLEDTAATVHQMVEQAPTLDNILEVL